VSDGRENVYPRAGGAAIRQRTCGALMIGDLWHWGLKDDANHRDPGKAWRQLMRWLSAMSPIARNCWQTKSPATQSGRSPQVRVRDRASSRSTMPPSRFHVRAVGPMH